MTERDSSRAEAESEAEHAAREGRRDVEERTAPPGSVVYQAILTEGVGELSRGSAALWWSGLAAGLSMGFSLVTEGLLQFHLPGDEAWTPLLTKFGYSIGFLFVILGRQQLFTENTLTGILPLLTHKSGCTLRDVARLWSVVLIANLVGAALFALSAAKLPVFPGELAAVFVDIGKHAMDWTMTELFVRGIFAGWLIALMVWLLPYAESARVAVIVIVTYLVGLGGFPHIIAGSVEVMYVAVSGQAGWFDISVGYMLPTLLGNIVGGVALVAALNHAQVAADDRAEKERD